MGCKETGHPNQIKNILHRTSSDGKESTPPTTATTKGDDGDRDGDNGDDTNDHGDGDDEPWSTHQCR